MKPEDEVRFDDFLKAVETYELSPKEAKATAHTSAVTVRWEEIQKLSRKDEPSSVDADPPSA